MAGKTVKMKNLPHVNDLTDIGVCVFRVECLSRMK